MFSEVRLEKHLQPYLAQLEEERLAVVAKVGARTKAVVLAAFLMMGIVGLYVATQWNTAGAVPAFLVAMLVFSFLGTLIVGGISYVLLTNPLRRAYNQTIRGKIHEKALQYYNSSVSYYPERYIEESVFRKANLFRGFNRYSGDDLCTGNLADERSFEFSELKVLRKEHKSNSNTTSKTKTIFKGLFYKIALPNSLGGRVKIVPDAAEDNFGAVGKFMQGLVNKALSTVALEDAIVRFDEQFPYFERSFKVYSNEEAVARELITTDLVEQIKILEHYIGGPVFLSFDQNYCYLAVQGSEFLAVDINRSLLGTVFIDQLEENLDWCFGLLKHLSRLTATENRQIIDNPFKVNEVKEKLPDDSRFSEKKPAVPFKKSISKDNPFLL